MSTHTYHCTNETCRLQTEVIKPGMFTDDATITCPRCEQPATYSGTSGVTSILSSSTGGKTPIDVAIGRDAEVRWQSIGDRQKQRDRVRVEANQVGLHAAGYTKFEPISAEQRQRRTEGMAAIERDGYVSDPGSAPIHPRA